MSNEQIKQEAEKPISEYIKQKAEELGFLSDEEKIPFDEAVAFLTSFAARVRDEAIEECIVFQHAIPFSMNDSPYSLTEKLRSLKSQET